MGKEQACAAVINGVRAEGRALLETDEVLFRGEPRLKLPLSQIREVRVKGDARVLRHAGGEVSLALGAKQAAAWAKRILEPPGLFDKLGIGSETALAAINLDEKLMHAIETRARTVRRDRRARDVDMVVLGAESLGDLAKLGGLDRLIRADGGIWIVYPKGRKDIREADVLAAGRAAGWKDNKTCRVSDTHTALRFVIPLAAHPATKRR